MLHQRTSGSGEEYFKGFYHIWAWRPSWSCDPDYLCKRLFPLPKEAPQKKNGFDWPSGFRGEDVCKC